MKSFWDGDVPEETREMNSRAVNRIQVTVQLPSQEHGLCLLAASQVLPGLQRRTVVLLYCLFTMLTWALGASLNSVNVPDWRNSGHWLEWRGCMIPCKKWLRSLLKPLGFIDLPKSTDIMVSLSQLIKKLPISSLTMVISPFLHVLTLKFM